MSLAFTVKTQAEMFEFLEEKVWYHFEDQDTLWDAWAAANSSDANATKCSGRTLSINFSNKFISVWPLDPAYVQKWSGMCLKDYSSGMGGFCLLETNDTVMTATTTAQDAINIYGTSGNTNAVENQTTNRSVITYRLSADEFSASTGSLEMAWSEITAQNTESNT